MQAAVIPYRYGLASVVGSGLICGHHGEVNPLSSKRKQVLPLAKLKVGDALYIHKRETLPATCVSVTFDAFGLFTNPMIVLNRFNDSNK